ncbi:hypothetical protein GOBAR_DD08385 [Gossypium barbadense]|nr:hypothetical protein GOBAR_DD08385 [Gossypium barbadense]
MVTFGKIKVPGQLIAPKAQHDPSVLPVSGSQTTKNFVPANHNMHICKINSVENIMPSCLQNHGFKKHAHETTSQTTHVWKMPFHVKCKNKRFIQHKLSGLTRRNK